MKMRKLAIGATLAMAIVATGVAGGMTLADGSPDRRAADKNDRPAVVMAEGLELLSSATAEDWVSYGSAVVLVTVVGEKAGEVSEGDRQYEEGTIRRDVELRVDQRLWLRPDVQVPDQVTVATTGWAWTDNDPENRVEFVNAGRSRLEVGEQYLVALAQWPGTPKEKLASCEDEPEEGGWAPIGSYAVTPVTDGVVGVGEFEGTMRTLDDALQAAKSPEEAMAAEEGSLRGLLTGKGVDAVVPELSEAAGTVKPKEIPVPSC